MLPILPSVIIFGIIFGITGFTSDLPLYLVSSMSYIIFAGSSQFLILILLSDNDPIIAILIAGILINLRHVFYGAALNKEFQGMGKKKILAAYLLTDEAYLISTFAKKSDKAPNDVKIIDVVIGGGGLLWLSWNISTIIGYFIGQRTNVFEGIPTDFIVAGTFLGYLILQWEQSPRERRFILIIILLSFSLSFVLKGVYLLFFTLTLGMIFAQIFFPIYNIDSVTETD
ncbi:MAG: AzlC family ABC transporter permease [Candidatus Heimdallarchaeota archaeon]|nr:AzlC family ABC transporter permease [Candidatus Heimdallarchaeota archaeon]